MNARKMKKYIRFNIKRLTALILAVCLTLPLVASGTSHDDIDERIRQANERADKLQAENREREARIKVSQSEVGDLEQQKVLIEEKMNGVQARIGALNEVIELQKEAINNKQAEINSLLEDIADTEAEIERSYEKIKALDEENEENIEKFAQMVKSDYMTGRQGYLDVILSSADFFDLVFRTEVLRKAGELNVEFMNELLDAIREQERLIEALKDLQAQLDLDRVACEQEKAVLEEKLSELNEGMVSLDAEKQREQSVLLEYAADISELQGAINNMYRQYNATEAEIEEANRLVSALILEKQSLDRPNYSGDGFMWPLENRFRMITCDYGYDPWRGGMHRGIDVGNSGINGTPIYAVQSGTVIVANIGGWGGGYGTYIVIDHGGGVTTLYAHMQSANVSVGQEVTKGDVIGLVGSTGWSTGPHLHFEVRENGTAVSPWGYL
ncbi:MAG: peptidoglycan DD-metalloendopeptidase family protein [Oscillospiraceae bacterium]|nr:peptidoglycan DD-metalloendopeptidase family protein [Oscillospiraceae bacterium]